MVVVFLYILDLIHLFVGYVYLLEFNVMKIIAYSIEYFFN